MKVCSTLMMAASASTLPKKFFPLRTRGAILPGDSTVQFKDFDIPPLKPNEVLLQTKASTICGSDIRCIYREHLGKGAEGYQLGIIAGHEPAGVIVDVGEDTRRFKVGDRALVYHVSGCGVCNDCRRGFMNSCQSPSRAAYGWQKNGGMANFMTVEEKDLVFLPEPLSFIDGAIVACSFGTVYEGLSKIGVSGDDQVLVVGLGPVGISALMLARALGASKVVGVDSNPDRCHLASKWATSIHQTSETNGDKVFDMLMQETNGKGFEKVIDCSGSAAGRSIGIKSVRQWGTMVLVGEGGVMNMEASEVMIHPQKTLMGSWVSSIWRMEDLVERLVRWRLHPEDMVTHRFTLDQCGEAYRTMADGKCGKVAVLFD